MKADKPQMGRQQPAEARADRPGGVAGLGLDQRGHGQHQEHDDLDGQQDALEPRGDLNAPVADIAHRDNPGDAGQQHPAAGGVLADAVRAEEQEQVLPGHLGEAGHDQDVGGHDGPAARPAGLGAERPRGPGERGPAVRVGLVHLAVADRAEQHRDERQHGDRGRLEPHRGHHEEQGRRQAVGRSRRGDAHHDAGDQPEGAALQALVFVFFDWLQLWRGGAGHASPSWL